MNNDNNKASKQFGPDNPHPLSTMKTELIWEGKYDEYGHRREVDISGAAMPMQKIETIDQPRSEAAAKGDQQLLDFETKTTRNDDFRNRLIWGDNKLVMASLLEEFRGKIDLIYIDPPFDVGADFTMNIPIGDKKENLFKDQSTLEMVAYRDMWGKGADSYLQIMYERLVIMRELLSERGSIYIHLGPNISSSIKIILDDIFGRMFFKNEIVWKRSSAHSDNNTFSNLHDNILFYSKSDSFKFNTIYVPYSEEYIKRYFRHEDEKGMYLDRDLSAKGLQGGGYNYSWKGKEGYWRCPKSTMEQYEAQGRIYWDTVKFGGWTSLRKRYLCS